MLDPIVISSVSSTVITALLTIFLNLKDNRAKQLLECTHLYPEAKLQKTSSNPSGCHYLKLSMGLYYPSLR